MSNVNLGSANTFFGAETAQFQQGVKTVTSDLDSLGGTYDQFGSRGARSAFMVTNGLTALTNATEMTATSASAHLNVLAFEFGHMAEMMQGAAGTSAKVVRAFGEVTVAASLVGAALYAGWKGGELIGKWTGLTDAMRDAGKAGDELSHALSGTYTLQEKVAIGASEIASWFGVKIPTGMENSVESFQQLQLATVKMAAGLGVAIPAAVMHAQATAEGAKAVGDFHDKLLAADKAVVEYMAPVKAIADELKKTAKAHDDLKLSLNAASLSAGAETLVLKDQNKIYQTAYEVITKHIAAERELTAQLDTRTKSGADAAAQTVVNAVEQQKYIETLMTTNALLKDPDPSATLEKRTEDMRLLGGAGADAGKLLKSELAQGYVAATEAALNSGKKVSDVSIQLSNAIKDNDIYAVEQWMKKWGEVPPSVDKAVTAATPHLDRFQAELAKGVTEPFGAGLKEFRAMAEEIGKTKIKVNFDVNIPELQAAIRRAIDDAASGAVPNTSGANR
jgi:hypothetical protein